MSKSKIYPTVSLDEHNLETERLEKRDVQITRNLKIIRASIRIFDFATSSANSALMGYCLAQYYLTVNGGNGNENFWPPASNLALYPTYLCFVVGTLSAIFSLAVLAGYCWGTDTADRWDDRRGWLTKAGCVIKIILSAVVAINMKVTSNTDSPYSLWSVVCDTTSQKKFLGLINFNRGCSFQMASFALNIVSIGSEVLTGLTFVLGWWGKKHKEKMEKHKSITPVTSPLPEKFENSLRDMIEMKG